MTQLTAMNLKSLSLCFHNILLLVVLSSAIPKLKEAKLNFNLITNFVNGHAGELFTSRLFVAS
jgi:hypothetical protein